MIIARSLIAFYAITASITFWKWVVARDPFSIRRPVLVFTAGWHTVLAIMATHILSRGGTMADPWWIATYGSAFLGSLVGLCWIISECRERVVKEATLNAKARCNELCANHEVIVHALREAAIEVARKAEEDEVA